MREVAGVVHRLSDRFSPGYGFTALIGLAGSAASADRLAAILFGGVIVGGQDNRPGFRRWWQASCWLRCCQSESLLAIGCASLRPGASGSPPNRLPGSPMSLRLFCGETSLAAVGCGCRCCWLRWES